MWSRDHQPEGAAEYPRAGLSERVASMLLKPRRARASAAEPRKARPACTRSGILGGSLGLMMLLTACVGAGGDRTTYEYLPNMMDMPSIKAQERLMRSPVDGTIPRGYTPYPYDTDEGDRAGVELKNPLSRTAANFRHGQDLYNAYCIVCHGQAGKGDGSIVPKFPRPPSLHSDKVRQWSDGRIYHVISSGQNLMPSYATKISADDRWAVVHYLRALQRASQPTEEDIEIFKQRLLGSATP